MQGIGVTGSDLLLLIVFVNKSRIVSKAADEAVVLGVKVTVNSRNVTLIIGVEEVSAVTQFLLRPISHRSEEVAGRVEDTGPCLGQTGCSRTDNKRSSRKSVVLFGMGIHDVSIQLETLSKYLISSGDIVHRLLHRGDGRSKRPEVEPRRVRSRRDVKP